MTRSLSRGGEDKEAFAEEVMSVVLRSRVVYQMTREGMLL